MLALQTLFENSIDKVNKRTYNVNKANTGGEKYMQKEKEITQEKVKTRLTQFNEMEDIWEQNDETVKAYLEGCIHTASMLTLRGEKKAG